MLPNSGRVDAPGGVVDGAEAADLCRLVSEDGPELRRQLLVEVPGVGDRYIPFLGGFSQRRPEIGDGVVTLLNGGTEGRAGGALPCPGEHCVDDMGDGSGDGVEGPRLFR